MNSIQLLSELIRIPSYVAADVDESRLTDYCLSLLAPIRQDWDMIEQPVLGTRRNIILKNVEEPDFLFTAHLDTVPPSSSWTRDPFRPVIEGNRLYGLGAVDMKAGLASLLNAFLRYGKQTTRSIALLLYVGEEYDFCGMKAFLKQSRLRPRLIINPEPTDSRILHGCRGVRECVFTVEGKSAHAAMPDAGVNAIEAAFKAVQDLRRRLDQRSQTDLGRSTLNIAGILGGTALEPNIMIRPNIIPRAAQMTFELRLASDVSEAEIQSWLEVSLLACGARLVFIDFPLSVKPFLSKNIPADLLSKEIRLDFPPGNITTTGYFDTAMLCVERKSAGIICGPGPSRCAHQADEYVELDQVHKMDGFFQRLLSS